MLEHVGELPSYHRVGTLKYKEELEPLKKKPGEWFIFKSGLKAKSASNASGMTKSYPGYSFSTRTQKDGTVTVYVAYDPDGTAKQNRAAGNGEGEGQEAKPKRKKSRK